MNKVLSSITNESFFFSSDLSKEDSLINAHIIETERVSLLINYQTRRNDTMNYDILILIAPWIPVFWAMHDSIIRGAE